MASARAARALALLRWGPLPSQCAAAGRSFLPQLAVVAIGGPDGLPGGHRVDAAVLQPTRKHRPPPVQVCLARRQAHTVVSIGPNRQMHVWGALVFVKHEHVLVPLEQLTRRVGRVASRTASGGVPAGIEK